MEFLKTLPDGRVEYVNIRVSSLGLEVKEGYLGGSLQLTVTPHANCKDGVSEEMNLFLQKIRKEGFTDASNSDLLQATPSATKALETHRRELAMQKMAKATKVTTQAAHVWF